MSDTNQTTKPAGSTQSEATKTSLSRAWLWRVGLWLVLMLGLGSWGLYDALVAYPNRGEAFASAAKFDYLAQAKEASTIELGIFRSARLSIDNPAAELERLESDETRLLADVQDQNDARRRARASLDLAKLQWLEALGRIGKLDPEHTTIGDPTAELDELRQVWESRTRPSPLAFYDIPSQWVITAVGYAVGLYVLVLFLRVAATSYSWDPNERRLTLPDRTSIVPADLEDLDKRRWDKFIVYLKIRDEHEQLAGREIKIDLFRYNHLERWILEMEREQFPDRAEDQTPDTPDSGQTTPDESTPKQPEPNPSNQA
jgi:hypothetical protein